VLRYVLLLCLIAQIGLLKAQPMQYNKKFIDSIVPILPSMKEDTTKVNMLSSLAAMHLFVDPTKTLFYAKQGLELAKKIKFPNGQIGCLGQAAFCNAMLGEWAKATFEVNEAIPLCEKYNPQSLSYMCNIMVIVEFTKQDLNKAKYWVLKAKNVIETKQFSDLEKWPTYMQLGLLYSELNQLDSAAYCGDIVLGNIKKFGGIAPELKRDSYSMLGSVALKKNDFKTALEYFRLANNDALGLASLFQKTGNFDSAVYYGLKGLEQSRIRKSPNNVQDAAKLLASLYKIKNPSLANEYLNIYIASKDSLYSSNKLKQLEEVQLNVQKNEYEMQIKETAIKNKFIFIFLLIIVLSISVLMYLVYRNNRQKNKANQVLQNEKQKVENTLAELKSTQAQLIQSEKMASLGQLTAGIAHEIQNPLNFVNNFSEVTTELVKEMVEEVDKGNTEEVKAIAQDVVQNLEKINHHGQRAADIVKGMLQHSRSSSGVKEPTDINSLADEYLRLAYHGLRAKDKEFNATMKTDFDNSVGKINIIPQDLGRVILNLITNAFYVVNEKSKQNISEYESTVWVKTKKSGDKILISVKDNGNGIPPKILDKIFQPFFTTKPTGQGTGLGLSLSYDIVKAHGGELKVETTEGEGTTFIISLPVNN
jgi:signal transduction histidine kinase